MFEIYICAAIALVCAGVMAGILALTALGKRSPSSGMD